MALAMSLLTATFVPAWAGGDASRPDGAIQAYDRASRLRAQLEAQPEKARSASEYREVIHAFVLVFSNYPRYRDSPAALATAAQLYEEMARTFARDTHYESAIKVYRILSRQYPHTEISRDAIYSIAEIYRAALARPEDARRAYQQVIDAYPGTAKAREARSRLRQMSEIATGAPANSPPVHPSAEVTKPLATKPVTLGNNPPVLAQSPGAMTHSGSEQPLKAPDSAAFARLTGVRCWKGPNYVRVVLTISDEVQFTSSRMDHPERLVFDLRGAEPSHDLLGRSFSLNDAFLREIRIGQFQNGITRTVLDLNQLSDYSVFSLPNPFRLVIDIHGKSSSDRVSSLIADANRLGGPTSRRPLAGASPIKQEDVSKSRVASRADLTSGRTNEIATALPASPSNQAIFPSGQGTTAGAGAASARQSRNDADSALAATLPAPDLARAQPRTLPPSATTRSGSRTLTRVLGLKISRIVIDAGHGGHDTGTIGPHGVREKDVVLDVALRLKRLLEDKAGAEVILTRSDDTFIPLQERTAVANQRGADLFISIHANASSDPSARGIETFYLNFTSDRHALEVASRENATSGENVHDLQTLIQRIALTEKVKESQDLAGSVQRSLWNEVVKDGNAQRNRGVKRAPFVVLIGANMPSILAEISFITNPRDERNLKKATYRENIAEALFSGIERYTDSLGGIRVAQKATPPLSPTGTIEAVAATSTAVK